MNRLTDKKEAAIQRRDYMRRIAHGCPRNLQVERFLRLAAYENTGREPEEIEDLVDQDEVEVEDLCDPDDTESLYAANLKLIKERSELKMKLSAANKELKALRRQMLDQEWLSAYKAGLSITEDLISRADAIAAIREQGCLSGSYYSPGEIEDDVVEMLEQVPAVDATQVLHDAQKPLSCEVSFWQLLITEQGPAEPTEKPVAQDIQSDYKAFHDSIMALPSCNTCAKRHKCLACPKPGSMVRFNCPLYISES